MDETGPNTPLRGTPPKDPVDRATAAMERARQGGDASSRGVEVVATSEQLKQNEEGYERAASEAIGADEHLGEQAADQARQGKAKLEDMAQQAKGPAYEQAEHAKQGIAGGMDNIVALLGEAARQLDAANQAQIAQMVRGAADSLQRLSSDMRERDVGSMLDQAGEYTRRQPLMVIAGSVIIGYLLARLFGRSGK